MTALRVVVVDDERPARRYLRELLDGYEDVVVVGEATNGLDAIALIERASPDLALIDLQLPELDGLDVVRALRRGCVPLVAFVTAYDHYAVQAFEVHAVDYLLKPVDAARLRRTITRAQELLEQRDVRLGMEWSAAEHERIARAAAAIAREVPPPTLRRLPVRRKDDIVFVNVHEIASIVADGELLWITTSSGVRYQVTHRLKDLEARLDPSHFLRLSRGVLVNVDMIARVSPMPGGTFVVLLTNRQQLTVSRSRSRLLRETLLRL